MSKTQAALQRRLGRLSMLIDLVAEDYEEDSELITAMKKEIALIKEISLRLVELPHQHGPEFTGDEGPKARGRR